MAAAGFNTPPKTRAPKRKDESDAAYGMPRPPAHPEIPGTCTTPRCGAVADSVNGVDLPGGWVRAGVYGSTDPDRVWCSGLCSTRGIALAELRVKTTRRRANA